jgi:hypothetical protein
MVIKFELVDKETTKMYQSILPSMGRTLLHNYNPKKGHLMICKKDNRFILHNIDNVNKANINKANILIEDDDIVNVFDFIQSKL